MPRFKIHHAAACFFIILLAVVLLPVVLENQSPDVVFPVTASKRATSAQVASPRAKPTPTPQIEPSRVIPAPAPPPRATNPRHTATKQAAGPPHPAQTGKVPPKSLLLSAKRRQALEANKRRAREARITRARQLGNARERAAWNYHRLARKLVESATRTARETKAKGPKALAKVFEQVGTTLGEAATYFAKGALRMRQAESALKGTNTAVLNRSPNWVREALETTDQAAQALETAGTHYEQAELSKDAARVWDKSADLRIEIMGQLTGLDQ